MAQPPDMCQPPSWRCYINHHNLSLSPHHHLHRALALSFTLPPLLSASFPACLLAADPPSVALPICLTAEFLSSGAVALPAERQAESEGNNVTVGERSRGGGWCQRGADHTHFVSLTGSLAHWQVINKNIRDAIPGLL